MSFGHRRARGLWIASAAILVFVMLSMLDFAAFVRVPLAWFLLLIVPGWLAGCCSERLVSSHGLQRWAVYLVLGWCVVLGSSGVAALVGLPPHALLWIWGTSCVILALIGVRRGAAQRPAERVRYWPVVILLGCMVFLARTPPQLNVEGDLAAHLGGIHDSIEQGRWLPMDHSVDPEESRRDPRFGMLHGIHGAMAEQLGLDVLSEVQKSAPFFAALFIVSHAALFLALGLPLGLSLAAAILYALGAAGGAPLGWWAAFYPSQVAMGIAAGCAAFALADAQQTGGFSGSVLGLVGIGLGLSALVHPFAWWAWGLILVHAALLAIASPSPRVRLMPLAVVALPALVVGVAVMLPLLLQESRASGAQWQPAGIMMVGDRFFTMDPLVVTRFGGGLGLLAAPLFLIATRTRWRREPGIWLGLAAALPVWTIAMNPLLQPLVFAKVGYLSERLGELAWVPALGLLPFFSARPDRRAHLRRPPVLRVVAASTLLLGIPHALGAAIESPYHLAVSQDALGSLNEGIVALEIQRPAIDPGLSYLIRGAAGGVALVQPVEHCSPLDLEAPKRLADYRGLLSPDCPTDSLAIRLEAMGADGLVLDEAVEERYSSAVYGFVPSSQHQVDLVRRLEVARVMPDLRLGTVCVYSLGGLRGASSAPDSTTGHFAECDAPVVDPVVGEHFTLLGLGLESTSVAPGEELRVRLCYALDDATDAWEVIHLRFEGPMPEIPGWATSFSKVYRKLFVERSGRSRARFRDSWVPLDGYGLEQQFSGASQVEWRSVRIPADIQPGEYGLQVSVRDEAWRPVRRIEDFLKDEDSWSAPVIAVIQIVAGEEGR